MARKSFSLTRWLTALAVGVCVTGGAALAQDAQPFNPTPTPQQIPPGWTETEAKQWLLPNQSLGAYGSPLGQALEGATQNLRFLAGRHLSCRNILGSLLKCCKAEVPDQQEEWWKAYAQSQRQTAAVDVQSMIAHVQGAWSQVQDGAGQFSLDAPLTSQYENIQGGGSGPQGSGGKPNEGSLPQMNADFMANENANVKPHLGWWCDDSDFDTAVGKNLGQCHYLGSDCQIKILGQCIYKKEVYCCFNSPTSRILREHLLERGIGPMGSAKHPDCSGISVADLQNGVLGDTPTAEIIGRMQAGGFLPKDLYNWDESQIQYTGSQSAMGDPSRLIVSDRTSDTIDRMDPASATSSIYADVESMKPTATISDPQAPGEISFAAGYLSVTSGRPISFDVSRNGGLGMVSIDVVSAGDTAQDGVDFIGVNQTLYWGNGDLEAKKVSITTMPFVGGAARKLTVVLKNPTGDPKVTPYVTLQVDLQPSGG